MGYQKKKKKIAAPRKDTSAKAKSKPKKVAKEANSKLKEGTYSGVIYESGMELTCLHYLFTLKKQGYVSKIERSESYLLCDSVMHNYSQTMKRGPSKPIMQCLRRGHSYTPDYKVTFTQKAVDKFCWILGSNSRYTDGLFICDKDLVAEIEVKPDFDKRGTTAKSMNDMKWVWQKHGIYINLFKPSEWYENTFTPKEYLFTERGIKRTLRYKVRTFDEYLKTVV